MDARTPPLAIGERPVGGTPIDDRPGGGRPGGDRGGRPAATSAHELAAVAQALFVARGFDGTGIDDIAEAAGISRRTFFRYFRTKADVLFVEAPAELTRLCTALRTAGPATPYRRVVTNAVVEALRVTPGDREWALQRAQVVLSVPSLQAHAAVALAHWRTAVTDYARLRFPDEELFAVALGHAVVAATQAAHEYWTVRPDRDLVEILRDTLRLLLPPAPGSGRAAAPLRRGSPDGGASVPAGSPGSTGRP